MSARTWAFRAAAPAAFALAFGTPADAQEMGKPRLEPARAIGETVVGGYAGIGGFLLGKYVAERGAGIIGVESDVTARRIGFAGGVVGGGLATAGVVYGIGSMGNQTGDFNATYLGTGVGFVAALGIARVVLGPAERPRPQMSTARRWATVNALAMLPAIGATIGFNSTRRYR